MYSVPTLSNWFALDLSKKIPANLLDPALLEGVYIPNLVVSPFTVSKGYAELIYNRTSSPKVLRKWDEEGWDAPEQRQKLAWVLLVELLSYQFASPVRRIETLLAVTRDKDATKGIGNIGCALYNNLRLNESMPPVQLRPGEDLEPVLVLIQWQ